MHENNNGYCCFVVTITHNIQVYQKGNSLPVHYKTMPEALKLFGVRMPFVLLISTEDSKELCSCGLLMLCVLLTFTILVMKTEKSFKKLC